MQFHREKYETARTTWEGELTGDQLKYVKRQIGYATCDMYRELDLPRRTYQDYEAGHRRIPDTVACKVLLLYRADRRWTRSMGQRIDEALEGGLVPNEAGVDDGYERMCMQA